MVISTRFYPATYIDVSGETRDSRGSNFTVHTTVDLVVSWLFALTQIGPCHEGDPCSLSTSGTPPSPFPYGAGPRHMASRLMGMVVQRGICFWIDESA
jgi:hypothetical protein